MPSDSADAPGPRCVDPRLHCLVGRCPIAGGQLLKGTSFDSG
jgi:hypothetical protein